MTQTMETQMRATIMLLTANIRSKTRTNLIMSWNIYAFMIIDLIML